MLYDINILCLWYVYILGTVTDLLGRKLDFSRGRFLAADVTGIVGTSDKIHKKVINTINDIQADIESRNVIGQKVKLFGRD